jgi:NAD(P)-dependent dehydrogenase (short-subunit alcohol dehydrogenase family)
LFQTNYFGVVHGCCVAVPHLKESGGALITLGSIASDLPPTALGAYAASKHAIKAYVETLRMELHADDVPIAATLIKPSGIDTPIAQHAANHGPARRWCRRRPMRPNSSPMPFSMLPNIRGAARAESKC